MNGPFPVFRPRARSVVAIGDSITYGADPATVGRYEATLQTALGAGWTVTNKGVSGNGTEAMLARFTADVINLNPGYVIIMGGVNDADAEATIKTNLAAMYLAAHNAGIKVIALTITPTKGNLGYWSEAIQTAKDNVNSWIMAVPDNVDFAVDVYTALEDPEDADYMLPAYRDPTGYVHPTNAGQDVIANTIYAAVSDF